MIFVSFQDVLTRHIHRLMQGELLLVQVVGCFFFRRLIYRQESNILLPC